MKNTLTLIFILAVCLSLSTQRKLRKPEEKALDVPAAPIQSEKKIEKPSETKKDEKIIKSEKSKSSNDFIESLVHFVGKLERYSELAEVGLTLLDKKVHSSKFTLKKLNDISQDASDSSYITGQFQGDNSLLFKKLRYLEQFLWQIRKTTLQVVSNIDSNDEAYDSVRDRCESILNRLITQYAILQDQYYLLRDIKTTAQNFQDENIEKLTHSELDSRMKRVQGLYSTLQRSGVSRRSYYMDQTGQISFKGMKQSLKELKKAIKKDIENNFEDGMEFMKMDKM